MPTCDRDKRFLRDWERLTRAEQDAFKAAVRKFVHDLRTGRFRAGLPVRGYEGTEGVYEMTWADDGRALFRYGAEVRPGESHIEWLRIGTHDIF